MKNNRLSIGQMAELNHTTLATLRLYDENGLLKPVRNVDPTNGYRIYDVLQSTAFHIIQYNKELSLSLKEIKEVLDRSDFDFLSAAYRRKLVDLDKELKGNPLEKTEIEKILLWMDYFRHLPPAGTFTMAYIPKSYVYAEPAADYFQEDFGSVVYDLSHMEGALRQKGARGIYPYDAFLSMKLDDFEAGHYRTEQLGVNLPKEEAAKLHAEVWPSNMSACVYLDDFTQAADYLDQLAGHTARSSIARRPATSPARSSASSTKKTSARPPRSCASKSPSNQAKTLINDESCPRKSHRIIIRQHTTCHKRTLYAVFLQ